MKVSLKRELWDFNSADTKYLRMSLMSVDNSKGHGREAFNAVKALHEAG